MATPDDIAAIYERVLADGPKNVLLKNDATEEAQYIAAQLLARELEASSEGTWKFISTEFAPSVKVYQSVTLKVASVVVAYALTTSTGSAVEIIKRLINFVGDSCQQLLESPELPKNRYTAIFSLRLLEELNACCLSVPVSDPIPYPEFVQPLRDVIRETDVGHELMRVLVLLVPLTPTSEEISSLSIGILSNFIIWVPLELLMSLGVIESIGNLLTAQPLKCEVIPISITAMRSLCAKGMPNVSKVEVVDRMMNLIEHFGGVKEELLQTTLFTQTVVELATEIINQVTRLFSEEPSIAHWCLVERSMAMMFKILGLSRDCATKTMWKIRRPFSDAFWMVSSQLFRKLVSLYSGCPSVQPDSANTLESRGGDIANIHHRKYKSHAPIPCEALRSYAGSSVRFPVCHPMTEDLPDSLRQELSIDILNLRPILPTLLDHLIYEMVSECNQQGVGDQDQSIVDCIRMVISLDPEIGAITYVKGLWLNFYSLELRSVCKTSVYCMLKVTVLLQDHYKDLNKLIKLDDNSTGLRDHWSELGSLVCRLPITELASDRRCRTCLLELYYEVVWKILNTLVPAIWKCDTNACELVLHFTKMLCSPCGVLDCTSESVVKTSTGMLVKLCRSFASHVAKSGALEVIDSLLITPAPHLSAIDTSKLFDAFSRLLFSPECQSIELSMKEELLNKLLNSQVVQGGDNIDRSIRSQLAIIKHWNGFDEILNSIKQNVVRSIAQLLETEPLPRHISLLVSILSCGTPVFSRADSVFATQKGIRWSCSSAPLMDPEQIDAIATLVRVMPFSIESAVNSQDACDALGAFLSILPSGKTVLEDMLLTVINVTQIDNVYHQRNLLEPLINSIGRVYGSSVHSPKDINTQVKTLFQGHGRMFESIEYLLWHSDLNNVDPVVKLAQLQTAGEVLPIQGYLSEERKSELAEGWLSECGVLLLQGLPPQKDVRFKIIREKISTSLKLCNELSPDNLAALFCNVLNVPNLSPDLEHKVNEFIKSRSYFTGDMGAVERWKQIYTLDRI
eukprot:GHVH01008265.1.p1 GENE.GHVH01008265.1~~GHVH01008265.1.p1  ORF type:complete len:1023 (+),score=125.67 GHVH01008265.1:41-3109(+)